MIDDPSKVGRLLVAVAAGDEKAFLLLHQMTTPILRSVIHNLLRDSESASDALQETYLTVWRRAASFDPQRGAALSWLVAVARNKALDHMRSQARRPAHDDIDDKLEDGDPDPEAHAVAKSLNRSALQEMSKLPHNMRAAVMLRVFYDLDYDEIAGRLSANTSTVKSWVRRGLIKLQKSEIWLDHPIP